MNAARTIATGVMAAGLALQTVTAAGPLEDALEQYVRAGDAQDVTALEQVLDEAFVSQYAFAGENGEPPPANALKTAPRSDFIDNFASRKWGGKPREIDVVSHSRTEPFGFVRARLASDTVRFDGLFVFVSDGERWQLVREFLVAERR